MQRRKRKQISDALWEYYGQKEAKDRGENAGRPDPEPPDLLIYYFQLKRFDWRHLPWPGGMSDQPYQLMFEISVVDEFMLIRQRLQEQWEKQQAELQKQFAPR